MVVRHRMGKSELSALVAVLELHSLVLVHHWYNNRAVLHRSDIHLEWLAVVAGSGVMALCS